jgi:hypothetical protein
MSSASSPVSDALASYVAGRIKSERVVIAVAAAFYGARGGGERRALQPLIDVIDRASPGIVELGSVAGGVGFEIRLAERPFPRQYEAALRRAAELVLAASGGGGHAPGEVQPPASAPGRPAPARGVLARLVGAIRRLFSAAT